MKDKRVLCFAGRIHHWQRLKPVMDELRRQGADARYLISENTPVQNDFAEEYLVPAQEPFVHTADFIALGDMDEINRLTREMMNETVNQKVEAEQDGLLYVPPFWWAATLREVSELLVAYRKVFREVRPDCVLVLHEANYWCKLIAYLCHEMGIPCIGSQEGLLRHRDQATQGKFNLSSEYVSKVIMWSGSAQKAYVAAGVPESKLYVGGIPHLDFWFRAMQDKNYKAWCAEYKASLGFRADKKLVSFCLPLVSRYDGSPKKALGELADWSINHYTQVAFRFHPFENEGVVKSMREAIKEHPYAKVVDTDTLALVACSDLVLSQHSTIALETLALGVPLAEIDLDNAGVLESFSEQGVAIKIGKGELGKIGEVLSGKIVLDSDKLVHWLDENVGARDGNSAVRWASQIAEMM